MLKLAHRNSRASDPKCFSAAGRSAQHVHAEGPKISKVAFSNHLLLQNHQFGGKFGENSCSCVILGAVPSLHVAHTSVIHWASINRCWQPLDHAAWPYRLICRELDRGYWAHAFGAFVASLACETTVPRGKWLNQSYRTHRCGALRMRQLPSQRQNAAALNPALSRRRSAANCPVYAAYDLSSSAIANSRSLDLDH